MALAAALEAGRARLLAARGSEAPALSPRGSYDLGSDDAPSWAPPRRRRRPPAVAAGRRALGVGVAAPAAAAAPILVRCGRAAAGPSIAAGPAGPATATTDSASCFVACAPAPAPPERPAAPGRRNRDGGRLRPPRRRAGAVPPARDDVHVHRRARAGASGGSGSSLAPPSPCVYVCVFIAWSHPLEFRLSPPTPVVAERVFGRTGHLPEAAVNEPVFATVVAASRIRGSVRRRQSRRRSIAA